MRGPPRGSGPHPPAMPPHPWTRYLRRALAAAAAAACAAALPAVAGVTMTDPDGNPIRWDLDIEQANVVQGEVTWFLDPRGVTEEPLGDVTEQDALYAAFAAWESLPGGQIRFQEETDRRATERNAKDRVNFISWRKFVLGPFTLAATFSASENGVLTDADVVMNDQERFVHWATTTPGTGGHADVQAVLTHEVGHLCGLDHSPVAGATMSYYIRVGSISGRTLEGDDASSYLDAYPPGLDTEHGSIVGTLRVGRRRTARGIPVFALDPATLEPAGCSFTDDTGLFRITGLAPGPYLVAAAPLADTGPYSTWWSASPARLEAAFLGAADPEAEDGVPAEVIVRAGVPVVAGEASLRKARRRGRRDPDGDPEHARGILLGAGAGGAFERALDEDWFRFHVDGTGPLEIRVIAWGIGSAADADLAVFDGAGEEVLAASFDQRPALDVANANGDAGVDPDPLLTSFDPPAPGDYLVRVRAQPQSGYGSPGAFYLLRIRPLGPP